MVFFGILIGLAICEGILRLAFPRQTGMHQQDSRLGWVGVPNQVGLYSYMPDVTRIRATFNSRGFRDEDHSYNKPDGVFRILVLGDSFVEARQVPQKNVFTEILEYLLNKQDNPFHFEVINAGVSGYSTDQEYLYFITEGYKYQPDLVLLAFLTQNDIWNNSIRLDVRTFHPPKPYFSLDKSGLLQLSPLKSSAGWREKPLGSSETGTLCDIKSVLTHLRLYLFVGDLLPMLAPGLVDILREWGLMSDPGPDLANHPDFQVYAMQYSPEWEEAWAITKALILALDNAAAKHGAELAVVALTNPVQVYPKLWERVLHSSSDMRKVTWDLDKTDRILSAFLEENDLPHLELLPFFRENAEANGMLLHYPADGHWNKDGNRLAAELIYEWLMSSGLAPAK